MIFGAAAALAGLTSIAIRRDRVLETPQREYRNDTIQMSVPASMQWLEERNLDHFRLVIFGTKDDCSGYFLRFLSVAWSRDEIATKQILPSTDYQIESESRAEVIELFSGRPGTLSQVVLRVRKPCGQLEKHDLSIVRFRSTFAGWLAVAGFVEPFLPRRALIEVARSVTGTSPRDSGVPVETHADTRYLWQR